LVILALLKIEIGKIIERHGEVGVCIAEGRFSSCERLLVQRPGSIILALLEIQASEVAERICDSNQLE